MVQSGIWEAFWHRDGGCAAFARLGHADYTFRRRSGYSKVIPICKKKLPHRLSQLALLGAGELYHYSAN